MDEELKSSMEEVRQLISEGKKEDALDIVNTLLSDPSMKPYEGALKKIKVDIIYALNLERIEPELGQKAYTKVAAELDSIVSDEPPQSNTQPKASTPPPSPAPKPVPTHSNHQQLPMIPIYPIPLPPVVRVQLPPGANSKDPYDIDSFSIEDEIGPMGILNDIQRTFVSLTDPLLPVKMLKKSSKKS